MEKFRSQSCRDGRNMELECYNPSGMRDLRSYSTSSYGKSLPSMVEKPVETEVKFKKGKGNFGSTKKWGFSDPELLRKKRVASYKGYSLEGKIKGSFRKSFRWVKDSYSQVVHGWK